MFNKYIVAIIYNIYFNKFNMQTSKLKCVLRKCHLNLMIELKI